MELIEFLSVDCTAQPKESGIPTAKSRSTKTVLSLSNGNKTKNFWDGKIRCRTKTASPENPQHLRRRNGLGALINAKDIKIQGIR